MTIVASVKVRDGLILATDSMSHIYGTGPDGSQQFYQAFENSRKLFQIGELPIGVMAYGLGNVGERSIEGLMLEFAEVVGNRTKVESVAKALFEFIHTKYVAEGYADVDEPPDLGFYLAGYSPRSHFPDEWEFTLPRDPEPIEVRPENAFGASWRGVEAPFTRLWGGFPLRLPARLEERGWSQEEIEELLAEMQATTMIGGMPVQDAINFAVYILRVTIGFTEFSLGVPACGGPLQVATILADRDFQWIEKPDLRVLD